MHCYIWLAEERKPMDDPNNTTGTLEADEDILTYTVSDEVLEAAAGFGAGDEPSLGSCDYTCLWGPACIS
jgi:hypothetical protein